MPEDVAGAAAGAATFATGWWWTLLLGGFIIVIFADERLNRPLNAAKDTYRRRERLVALLAPVQLSQRRLYRNGFAFYTGLMLMVYLVLSFGASVIGPFFIPNAEDTIGGPEWPLVVALVMTGLLPALKPLQRIENKIRDYAYVLAGVPNSFHDFTDALMHVDLDETRFGYDLVQNDEALKLQKIFDAAKFAFGNNYEYKAFADHTGKLFAFRSWHRNDFDWPNYSTRHMFRAVEAEVKPQALAVLAELEDLAASSSQDTDSEIRTERWRSIAERMKASADDVCALFALYAEHATTLPVHDNPISNLLRDLIERAEGRRRRRRPELDIICLAVVGIAMLAFAIGLLGTAFGLISYPHDNLRQALPVATGYLVGALLLYGPATFVAWDARHPIRQGDWQNAYEAAVVPPARQYLALFLIAYCVTVASQALFSLGDIALTHIGRAGDATVNASAVIDQFIGRLPEGETPPSACETGKQPTQAMVWFAFSYGIVGAFHAVMFALLGDAVSARKENTAGYRLIALHGVVLALAVCLAGMLMDRHIPCREGDGTIVPALNLNLAEELIAFEMLAAFILGVTFASLARMSLVRLRDRPLAPVSVSSGSQDG